MGCGCEKDDKKNIKNAGDGCCPAPVIEVKSPEEVVMFHKVVVPVALGDESTYPAVNGLYKNVLMVYESNGHAYLYSSDGIPSYISFDTGGVITVSSLPPVAQASTRFLYVTADGTMALTTDNETWTVFAQGEAGIDFDTLTNRPKYAGEEMTSETNIPSVLDEENARILADADLQEQISSVKTTADSAVQPDDLNVGVVTDIANSPNPSTIAVNLDITNTNLSSGSQTTTQIPLPVASATQAGVINKATYDAISQNTTAIEAISNGAVAIASLPASPSQAELTAAWQAETGITTLMNRASIYDITNDKLWTYYDNSQLWYATSSSAQVTINTFTNSSEGVIKGSTSVGQVFAENDGTGSVNGWDTLSGQVSTNTSKLSTIEQGAEVNVQSDWAQTDNQKDDFIKNKPTIPTVNNGTLTIQRNGTVVESFSANDNANKTANISVPTIITMDSAKRANGNSGKCQLTIPKTGRYYIWGFTTSYGTDAKDYELRINGNRAIGSYASLSVVDNWHNVSLATVINCTVGDVLTFYRGTDLLKVSDGGTSVLPRTDMGYICQSL